MSTRFHPLQISMALGVSLAAMWIATQWTAAMFLYQPALGAAWLEFASIRIYAPWQLFSWWLAFDGQAPDVFARAGALAAAGGLLSGALAFGGAAWRASHRTPSTTYGSARWADGSDVMRADLLGDTGVVLGLYDERYLRHDGPEHVLAVAPTRSGKGVGLVLPTLLSWTGSAVIHDIKGENWTLTAGWRSRFSDCLRFDPTDPQFQTLLAGNARSSSLGRDGGALLGLLRSTDNP